MSIDSCDFRGSGVIGKEFILGICIFFFWSLFYSLVLCIFWRMEKIVRKTCRFVF